MSQRQIIRLVEEIDTSGGGTYNSAGGAPNGSSLVIPSNCSGMVFAHCSAYETSGNSVGNASFQAPFVNNAGALSVPGGSNIWIIGDGTFTANIFFGFTTSGTTFVPQIVVQPADATWRLFIDATYWLN